MVENFLYRLEKYFKAMCVINNATKICNAPIFLQKYAQ